MDPRLTLGGRRGGRDSTRRREPPRPSPGALTQSGVPGCNGGVGSLSGRRATTPSRVGQQSARRGPHAPPGPRAGAEPGSKRGWGSRVPSPTGLFVLAACRRGLQEPGPHSASTPAALAPGTDPLSLPSLAGGYAPYAPPPSRCESEGGAL